MNSTHCGESTRSEMPATIAIRSAASTHITHSAFPGIGRRAPAGHWGPTLYCGRVSESLGFSMVPPPDDVPRDSARGAEILRAAVAHGALHLPRIEALLDQALPRLALRSEAQEEPDQDGERDGGALGHHHDPAQVEVVGRRDPPLGLVLVDGVEHRARP